MRTNLVFFFLIVASVFSRWLMQGISAWRLDFIGIIAF